jgi:mitochondrial fission protein ELM1
MSFPRIWVLPGNRSGDDAQVYALAEELGLPFETRPMVYNWRFRLGGRYMGASAISIVKEVREKTLVPPWPDLILIAGKHPVPVARWVQKQSGGRTRLVFIGHPRVPPETFDLVYTTRSYLTPEGASIRLLPVALSRYREPPTPTAEEQAWLDSLPRPHLLLMLGGDTRHWKMLPGSIAQSAAKLARRAQRSGGSLIVVGSPRTRDQVLDAIEQRLEGSSCEWRVVRHDFPAFRVLLDDADELFPTFDSVSMISESVITGKPTGIVPTQMSLMGRIALGRQIGENNRRRDLRRFSNHLIANRLAGTMDDPRAGKVENPAIAAAAEARVILDRLLAKSPGL